VSESLSASSEVPETPDVGGSAFVYHAPIASTANSVSSFGIFVVVVVVSSVQS